MEKNGFNKDEPVIMPEPEALPADPVNYPEPKAKPWLFIIIGFLVGGTLIAGVFLLFLQPSRPTSVDDSSSTDISEDATDTEILQTYESEILRADEDDQFILKLDKASRLVSMGKNNEALATLNAISREELDDFQLYQLYSTYIYLYESIGDTAEQSNYTDLFDEVYTRLDTAGRFEEAKKTEATE